MIDARVWRLSRSAETALETMCLIAFCLFGLAYFFAFSFDLDRYLGQDGYFQLALNSHDHLFYVDTLDAIRADGVQYGFNNNFGIAAVYWALGTALPFLVNDQITLLPFVFNLVIMLLTYLLWVKICDFYKMGIAARLSFFVNTSLLYFLQLINKDMLTIFAFLFVIYVGLHRRYIFLILAIPFFFLVRQQLAVFAVFYVYFMLAPNPKNRMWLAYVVTSLVGGILSVFAGFVSEDTMGDGFSAFLTQLNSHYFVGYLIFNPIRVLQYIVDVYMSFSFFTDAGGVDVAKLLRLPQLILLAVFWAPCLSLVTRFQAWVRSPAKPLVLTIVAYLLAWLMNPTVNARYVMLITPVLVLFVFYAAKPENFFVREGSYGILS